MTQWQRILPSPKFHCTSKLVLWGSGLIGWNPRLLASAASLFLPLLVLGVEYGAAAPADLSYLPELVEQATVARLAEEREWQVLLHYNRNWFGGFTSMQDD